MRVHPESEEIAHTQELFEVAGLTSMLSAKGRVCNNKVVILDKMTTLRNKLKGYIDEGDKKVKKRETDASTAKQAWLDAEGAYLIAKSKAESLDKQVAEDLKKVTSLTELLDLNKKRLAKVRASVTEQLSEIDEEEAIIRELLGYIGDLTTSTVDVDVSSLAERFSRGVSKLPTLGGQAAYLQAYAQSLRETQLPSYQESEDVKAVLKSIMDDYSSRRKALADEQAAAEAEVSKTQKDKEDAEELLVKDRKKAKEAWEEVNRNQRVALQAAYNQAKDSLEQSKTKFSSLKVSYEKQIAIIDKVMNRVVEYCKEVPQVPEDNIELNPGTYGGGSCPVNYYCPINSYFPKACPPNTASRKSSDDIYDCKAILGYFGAAGAMATACTAGSYCEAGTERPVACPSGTQSAELANELADCISSPGYYGPNGKPGVQCPAGSYCPIAASAPLACPSAYTSPAGSSSLSACTLSPVADSVTINTGTAFSYQTVPGLDLSTRARVEFSAMTRTDVHVLLTMGNGGVFEVVIGGWDNTKSTIRRSRAGADIVETRGTVLSATEFRTFVLDWSTPRVLKVFSKSSTGTLTLLMETPQQPESVLDMKTMAVSTYKASGTFRVQVGRPPCPANSYCPDGINVVACPANTVSVAYSTKPSDCKTARGYYTCDGKTASISGGACTSASFSQALKCPAGYFCPEDIPNPLACPANTVSADGAGAAVDCKPQPGFYGDNGNAASVCPAGFYCPGGSAAVRCPLGTTSAQGTADVAQCSVIRAYYGSEGVAATQCPDFTTSPAGSTKVTDCQAKRGFFGQPGQPATRCSENNYCPGDGSLMSCPSGTVSRIGAISIDNCFVSGKWFMKTYSSGGRGLSTMPDVSTLTFVGQTYVQSISFTGEDKFQQAIPGTPADRFATTFQGRFVVQNAGAYTFCTSSDDGSDLTVDGAMVVDNGGLHGTERRCTTTQVGAGMHDALVNFFENEGAAVCMVTWSGPDTNNVEVPLVPLDSCAISVADLKGGWVNQVRISANGVGTWDNGRRPNFSVKTTDTCGFFDTSFPDDRVFRGALSQDKNRLTFSPDNYWARTSA
jgi:hypothetical protein